jgi:hypothetical protein
MSEQIGVTFVAHPKTEADAARVVEAIARMAASFAMDGIWNEITLTPFSLLVGELEPDEKPE